MINFPKRSAGPAWPVPKLKLREYALFSEYCLKSNSAITPENCLVKRATEKTIKRPFTFRPQSQQDLPLLLSDPLRAGELYG
jgi:hypothetical protein